jgi:small subunit ribosomal protein S9
MAGQYYEAVGRRKEASARARVFPGDGTVTCNDKPAKDYFSRTGDYDLVTAPLKATGNLSRMSVSLKIIGGGVTGQTGAATMAIARALLKLDANYRKSLRKGGYLTRDDRAKERKKPGLKRARKGPTYTKR